MALIRETNQQYYVGVQQFQGDAGGTAGQVFTCTFNTDLSLGSTTSWDPTVNEYALNNFKIYTSATGTAGTWAEYILAYTVQNTPVGSNVNSLITITAAIPGNIYVRVELKDPELYYNYGGYSYVTLDDIVNNFLVGYVGEGKLIPSVKRTDVMFHAKRGLQEFSYDTLKSVKCQELTIPDSLSVVIPQDYVNYVKCSWIDNLGVQHIIYPTMLTTNPTDIPIQDNDGIPAQDNFGANVDGDSITEQRWDDANMRQISGLTGMMNTSANSLWWGRNYLGSRYGLDPSLTQINGWFTINEREHKFSFSSNLKGLIITLEYISDGLAYDNDTRVPKMAEEAMYMHIIYSILAGRSGVQEYVVQRYKKDRRAALRNAKIRLSNIKLDEIVRITRNKSKWIKH